MLFNVSPLHMRHSTHLLCGCALSCTLAACTSSDRTLHEHGTVDASTSDASARDPPSAFREGRFSNALALCSGLRQTSGECEASYCELIARAMTWVHDING